MRSVRSATPIAAQISVKYSGWSGSLQEFFKTARRLHCGGDRQCHSRGLASIST